MSMGKKGGMAFSLFAASALLVVIIAMSFPPPTNAYKSLGPLTPGKIKPRSPPTPPKKPVYMPPTPPKKPIYVPKPPKKATPPPKKPGKPVKPPPPYMPEYVQSTEVIPDGFPIPPFFRTPFPKIPPFKTLPKGPKYKPPPPSRMKK